MWPKVSDITNGSREITAEKYRFNLYKIWLSDNVYNANSYYKTNENSSVLLPVWLVYFTFQHN
jgi:hypothetical protein